MKAMVDIVVVLYSLFYYFYDIHVININIA